MISVKRLLGILNKVVVVGSIGQNRCYLNISEKKAVERYIKEEGISREDFDDYCRVFTINFEDSFGAYDIWNIEK